MTNETLTLKLLNTKITGLHAQILELESRMTMNQAVHFTALQSQISDLKAPKTLRSTLMAWFSQKRS
jgi:hypothetical protein